MGGGGSAFQAQGTAGAEALSVGCGVCVGGLLLKVSQEQMGEGHCKWDGQGCEMGVREGGRYHLPHSHEALGSYSQCDGRRMVGCKLQGGMTLEDSSRREE